MKILDLLLTLLFNVVVAQNIGTENELVIKNVNTTTNNIQIQKMITKPKEITLNTQNHSVTEHKKIESNVNPVELTQTTFIQSNIGAEDVDFKYYWFLLVGSSLTILGLIAFKSFRMRRSRKEVKYGKASASDEIEPLGGNSKWDEESSSENESEIFDINFLKNTRLQKQSDI